MNETQVSLIGPFSDAILDPFRPHPHLRCSRPASRKLRAGTCECDRTPSLFLLSDLPSQLHQTVVVALFSNSFTHRQMLPGVGNAPGACGASPRCVLSVAMRTVVLPPAAHVLCVVAALLSTTVALVSATEGDSLALGQSIKHNESLVSGQGSFRLGFFTSRPNHTYLGIWYNRISDGPDLTVVWVANRRRALPDSTAGSLLLSRNGSLVLADAAGTVYWSSDDPPAYLRNWPPVQARLREDGNLVVETGSDIFKYAWESFSEPTDTLLPGMAIGVNRRTGKSSNLTAWKARNDPSPGDYSWVISDGEVPQLLLVNGTVPLWRSGFWVDERYTEGPLTRSGLFGYSYVASDGMAYFFFRWNASMVTRITVFPWGNLRHLRWYDDGRNWQSIWEAVDEDCDKFRYCGANAVCEAKTSGPVCSCLEGFHTPQPPGQAGRQGGATAAAAVCERTRHLSSCPGGEDEFVLVSGVKLPDTSWATRSRNKLDGCRAECRRKCSCTAFTYIGPWNCITWFGNLTDLRLYSGLGNDLYVRVASDGRKSGKGVIIIIVVLITFVTVMLGLLLCLWRRRRMTRRMLSEMQPSVESWHCADHDGQASDFDLQLIHFNTLEIATNYFSFQNKLGEGGYGPVYKGKLPNEQYVAIKRLSKDSTQGLEEFKSEVKLVAKLQHTNLVRLLGCCIENEEKILVYEYMENQSLDKFIFDAIRGKLLDWVKRKHIIEGITQGLLYLHKYSRLRVVHRDLKTSNILLDEEWIPKIADFGLARIFSKNDDQSNTKRIIGTHGYMPPEYAMNGLFSTKSDVFSFGVLLLEILSGKKNSSIHDFGISRNLPGHAWELWREGRQLELVDPAMGNSISEREFSRCVHMALLCVQENPYDRPTMLDIVSMMNSDTASFPAPGQPAFFLVRHANVGNENGCEMENCSSSNNSVTLTTVVGR